VIATMSLGAAITAAKVADDAGLTVTLVGTPAQETGGGKILMLEREVSTASTRRSCPPGPAARCGSPGAAGDEPFHDHL
jgi:hypothetical protein